MGIAVKLPDGKVLELAGGATIRDAAAAIGARLAKDAVAGKVNGEVRDIRTPLKDGDTLSIITRQMPEGLNVLRHSAAHIMADAVQRLFPGTKVTFGPATETGFYYDFDKPGGFQMEDLEKIEAEMAKIIAADHAFQRVEISRDEAIRLFQEKGETFKVEHIGNIPKDEAITIFRHGDWVDLCEGPHIPSTGWIKAFKLTALAGAYWRGDERNPMLSRVYGSAFFDQESLDKFLVQQEEAKRRDHRKLGRELGLFSTVEEIGAGLVLWHPKGALVRKLIEDFWREEHLKNGYQIVYTPHVGKADLWKQSGHLENYKENMYAPMVLDNADYFCKPMNCPFHIHIFKDARRSYRELPVRYCELGAVYRYERSGVLHGLMRVRGFTQDDAHIFVQPEKLEEEVVGALKFCMFFLRAFGFTGFDAYVATRPEKAIGEQSAWDAATAALRKACEAAGLNPMLDEGGGAFYGPKIDVKIKDAIGRAWQLSTIQVDFNLPERFNLEYTGKDNAAHRPYMVHRAMLGSLERFFGILVEHYAGAFPAWLAPEQVRILPITERNLDYCQELAHHLRSFGVRVELDSSNEKLGQKIRVAEQSKIPLMVIVGDKDQTAGGGSLREHGKGDRGFLPREALIEEIKRSAARPS
ncbi:MAG: Threonine--tRNA ligase 2 [Myxococcota bacterium]|nr:Threonine--tRNA ligase 2 [Myxococcota bacterium]